MPTKEEFVAEVKTWINTPFHHAARVKNAGVDCVGLAVGAAKNLGIHFEDQPNYPTLPTSGLFEKAVDSQTDPVELDDIRIGDLMKFRIVVETQHLAVVTQVEPTILITHAYAPARKCVEVNFDDYWKERLMGVRRIKELV